MSITTFLDGIIAKLGSPAPTFEIGVKSWQNVIADNAVLPVIFFDRPLKRKGELKSNRVLEIKHNLILLFLDKSQVDFTADQHDAIIENMISLIRDFIIELSKDENVKSITNINIDEQYNILDCNLDGCILTLDLILYPTESVC